ncbi:hypothetical protein cyc_06363 [Cyclospora cayetanensis]|uniref:Uncharacterized protein n=1 Tax=Cyclospora cayetanensis TaxID=88456 RepID=A0A1D3CVC3_9EIME|nr:hypothetical protein cyc_06363 [Cyclospora cayetanensis]
MYSCAASKARVLGGFLFSAYEPPPASQSRGELPMHSSGPTPKASKDPPKRMPLEALSCCPPSSTRLLESGQRGKLHSGVPPTGSCCRICSRKEDSCCSLSDRSDRQQHGGAGRCLVHNCRDLSSSLSGSNAIHRKGFGSPERALKELPFVSLCASLRRISSAAWHCGSLGYTALEHPEERPLFARWLAAAAAALVRPLTWRPRCSVSTCSSTGVTPPTSPFWAVIFSFRDFRVSNRKESGHEVLSLNSMPCRWKRAVGGGRSPSLAAPDGVPWSRCLYGPTARGDKRLPIVLQRSLQHCRWLGASGRLSILRGAPFAPEGGPRVAARWRPLWNARAAESQSASSDFLSCGNSERRDLSTSSSSSKDRDLGVGGSCEAAVCPRQLGRRRAAALLRSTTTGSNSDGFPWNEEGLPAAFWRVSKGAAASGSSHGTAFHSPSEIVGGRKDADEDALSRRGLPAESAENAEMVAVARRRRRDFDAQQGASAAVVVDGSYGEQLRFSRQRKSLPVFREVATTRSLLSEDAAVSGLAALGQYLPPHLLAAAAGVAARTVPVESAAWRPASSLSTARIKRLNAPSQELPGKPGEAQAVAWFVLRHCQHHKTLAVLQKLREVLLSQLSLLSHQQRLQQQCRGLWPAPSLRDAASLATALLQCGTLDGYLLQQLWRAVCRSFLEDARAVALGGETSSLSAAAVRSVAVRAPPERVAVDGRRLAQAAAATQLRDRGMWLSLCRLLHRIQRVAPSQALSAFCCALPLGALPDALHAAGSSVDPSFGGFVFSLSQDFAWAAETPRDRFAAAQLLHLLASLASPAAAVTDTPLLQAVAAAVRARLLNPSNSNSNSASCGSSNTSLQLAVAQHIACCWIAVARLLLAVQESRDLAAAAVYPQLHPEEAHCLLAFRNSSKDSRLLPPTEAFAMFFDDVLKPSAAVLEALVAAEAADPIANFNAADPIRQSAEEQLHARLLLMRPLCWRKSTWLDLAGSSRRRLQLWEPPQQQVQDASQCWADIFLSLVELQAASTTRTTLPGPTELTCGSDAPKDAYRAPLFLQLIDQDGGQAQPGAVLRGLLLEAERRQRCLSLLQSPEQLVLLAFALHFFEGLDSMGAARCSKLQQLARRLSWRREAIVAAATAAAPDTAAAVASMEGNMKRRPFFSSASPCRYQDVPLLLPAAARHSGSSSSGVALQLGNSPRSWTDRWVWLFAAEAIALRHAAAAKDGCVEGGVSGPSPSPGEQPVLFLLSRRNFWLSNAQWGGGDETPEKRMLPPAAAPLRLFYGYLSKVRGRRVALL